MSVCVCALCCIYTCDAAACRWVHRRDCVWFDHRDGSKHITKEKKKKKNKQGERERVLSSEGKAWRMISLCWQFFMHRWGTTHTSREKRSSSLMIRGCPLAAPVSRDLFSSSSLFSYDFLLFLERQREWKASEWLRGTRRGLPRKKIYKEGRGIHVWEKKKRGGKNQSKQETKDLSRLGVVDFQMFPLKLASLGIHTHTQRHTHTCVSRVPPLWCFGCKR